MFSSVVKKNYPVKAALLAIVITIGLGGPFARATDSETFIVFSAPGLPTTGFYTPGSYSLSGATALVSLVPSPSVSVSSSTRGVGVSARFTYYWTINGPSNVIVPIDIAWSGGGSASSGGDLATFSLELYDSQLQFSSPYYLARLSTGGNAGTLSAAGPSTSSTVTGFQNYLSLYATATGSASAFVDPQIIIDPSFFANNSGNNPSNYSISISPGVGNVATTPAVPEPSTLAVLGFGLFAVSSLRRRKSA